MQINPQSGHLFGCFSDGHTGTIRKDPLHKPMCCAKNATGKKCSALATRYGCLEKKGELFYGYCDKHWDQIPDATEDWDDNLSRCANRIADNKELTLDERLKINQYNIHEILGIPQWCIESHISPQRTKEANNAIKQRKDNIDREFGKILLKFDQTKTKINLDLQLLKAPLTWEDVSMEESSLDSYEHDSFVASDDDLSDDPEASYEESSESVEVIKPLKRLKRKADIELDNRNAKKAKR